MNIQIRISDKAEPDAPSSLICTANFIMVARDGVTGKATTLNTLLLDDEAAQQNFIRGRFDAALKKEERKKRLTALRPSSDESELIHQIWLDIREHKTIDMDDAAKFIAISATRFESVVICQPQNMNRNGKIFGGYLMKIAYELARFTAYKFIGGLEDIYDESLKKTDIVQHHPQFVSSDEISFEHPVSIGCMIRNEACVACTDTMGV